MFGAFIERFMVGFLVHNHADVTVAPPPVPDALLHGIKGSMRSNAAERRLLFAVNRTGFCRVPVVRVPATGCLTHDDAWRHNLAHRAVAADAAQLMGFVVLTQGIGAPE